ncbi:hypothetical protein HPP92_003509 [Vanilla planifolia]|uniref:LOB domain-containing protein n=1 Tax=Vanilla planifolia TaxID=51239 RepID=A0A835VIZ2_VANPL|nr:hypothetical protein HPP92_003509 [Vanilla planifolia]
MGPCGACKFLRRKCVAGCVFAPYFDPDQGVSHFAAVHKRLDAVVTICYEAEARLQDPIYGCVAHMVSLQQQVVNLQAELSCLQVQLSTLKHLPPPLPPGFSVTEHPSSCSIELSSHFDPPLWKHQEPPQERLYGSGGGDLHELARLLIDRHRDRRRPSPSCHQNQNDQCLC